MKAIKSLGSNIAETARAIWPFRGEVQRPVPALTRPEFSLAETEIIERRELQLREERQRQEEEELIRIANDAQRQLAAFEQLVGRSHGDAESFGEQLRDTASAMNGGAGSGEIVNSLISLTTSMIEKTRTATEELRQRREEMNMLRASLDDAQKRADTDMLTQLANRRCFDRMLAMHIERAIDDRTPLTLAICDIDHFKSVNDRFGHQTGDGVLKLVAKILTDHCSRDGTAFRIGGEEFAVLFPAVTGDIAFTKVEGALADLNSRHIRQRGTGDHLGHMAFSAGIASFVAGAAGSSETLFADADRQLYAAKAAGRNRIFPECF